RIMYRHTTTLELIPDHRIRKLFKVGGWLLVLAAIMSMAGYVSGSEFPKVFSWGFLAIAATTILTSWLMEAKNDEKIFVQLQEKSFRDVRFDKDDPNKFTASLAGRRVKGCLEHTYDGRARVWVRYNE